MRILPAVLAMVLAPACAAASGADEGSAVRRYKRAVDKYNAHVLDTGSTMGEEAERLKADMEALRVRSENMRRDLGAGPALEASTSAAELEGALPEEEAPEELPKRPLRKRLQDLILPMALIGALACVLYIVESKRPRPKRPDKTAVIRCPGCKRKLRVPKRGRRVKVRCLDCGKQSAYNPKKKSKS